MKNIIKIIKKQILKVAKTCYDSPASFWQTAAITTISVYHLCQIIVIAINKDTPKKEKAFLIPQEIMDTVINLATFVFFAQSFKQIGRKLIDKNIIKPFKKDKQQFREEFAAVTNLAGSLLAVNIVSPVIRNKFGADVQEKFMKNQIDKKQKNFQPSKVPVFKNFSSSLKI